MILHLLTDEKFTDYVIEHFSELDSEFVLIPTDNSMFLVKKADRCRIVTKGSKDFDELLNSLCNYTGVFFHGLFWAEWQVPILKAMPDNVKVAWACWGGEIYSCKENEYVFRAPITKFVLKFRHFFLRKKTSYDWEVPKELYKRIDFCTTSIEEEYDYAVSFFHNKMRHIWYTYYSIEDIVGQLMTKRSQGGNVWVGNSAADCNNHLDVMFTLFKKKNRSKLKNVSIIVPLSYGLPWMRNLVVRVGHYLFGTRFKPLMNFLPRHDYNSLMLSCSTMVIGATEPLAQGNILTALWLGLRVYLSEKSMSYHFFKRIGAFVFSLEDDLNKYHFTSLTDEEVNHNREVISLEYGKEHVMQGALNLARFLS